MITKIKTLNRKFRNFIEKLRLSETEYLTMKEQSEKFEGMMSTCEFKLCELEFTDIKDKKGNILHRFPKSRTATLNINIDEMLKEAGIVYDKDRVTLNVK